MKSNIALQLEQRRADILQRLDNKKSNVMQHKEVKLADVIKEMKQRDDVIMLKKEADVRVDQNKQVELRDAEVQVNIKQPVEDKVVLRYQYDHSFQDIQKCYEDMQHELKQTQKLMIKLWKDYMDHWLFTMQLNMMLKMF